LCVQERNAHEDLRVQERNAHEDLCVQERINCRRCYC
jgi:hypothetical protein